MAYEHRRTGRQRLLYNNTNDDNPLVYQLVVDGVKVTPTSATIALWKPSAGSATVAAAAVSPGLSGTLILHDVDTTTTGDFPADTGFRADYVITYGGETYNRHVIFDVAKYYFDLAFGFDQLTSIDGEVVGSHTAGDEDNGNLIGRVADIVQSDIETKLIQGDMLLQNMILDNSRVSLAAQFRALAQIYANRDNEDKRDWYLGLYDQYLSSALGSHKFDTDQDGFEDSTPGGITPIVLHK